MIMRFSNFDDIVVYCVSEGFTFRVGTLDAFPPRLRSMSLCVLKSIGADHKHWVPQSACVKVAVFVRYYNQNFQNITTVYNELEQKVVATNFLIRCCI